MEKDPPLALAEGTPEAKVVDCRILACSASGFGKSFSSTWAVVVDSGTGVDEAAPRLLGYM